MDIEAKLNNARSRTYDAQTRLDHICDKIGMYQAYSGNGVALAIREYVCAMVEQRVYEIVTSPEYFALMVHAGANYGEAQDGLPK